MRKYILLLAIAAVPLQTLASDVGRIERTEAQDFRGWGSSLAWESNVLYGNSLAPSLLPQPAAQAKLLDLLYGDPKSRLTLGLNIARYNIGGGENPSHKHMRPQNQMDGFWDGPNQNFNWDRDTSQRKMLHEVKSRGANIFEAFSNSPPYWMTASGCAAGPEKPNQENLKPSNYQAFADYLATVIEHFKVAEGIVFESISPFNEPDGDWFLAGGVQEGYSANSTTQSAVIQLLDHELKTKKLSTFVVASDANNIDAMTHYLNVFPKETLNALQRVNIHQYDGYNPDAFVKKLNELGKPLWMSEYGCCLSGQSDGTEKGKFFWLAATIRDGLRNLGAEAWVMWQADWGILDISGGDPKPQKQFYAMAQFSNFIRPGFTILDSYAGNSVAAYSKAEKRLVIVTFNQWTRETNDYDLSAFKLKSPIVKVYRTSLERQVNLARDVRQVNENHHLIDHPMDTSVTTYVIDGAE